MPYKVLGDLALYFLCDLFSEHTPLPQCALTKPTFLLFRELVSQMPTSGPLHWLISQPGSLFPHVLIACSFLLLRSQLKCQLLRKTCTYPPV